MLRRWAFFWHRSTHATLSRNSKSALPHFLFRSLSASQRNKRVIALTCTLQESRCVRGGSNHKGQVELSFVDGWIKAYSLVLSGSNWGLQLMARDTYWDQPHTICEPLLSGTTDDNSFSARFSPMNDRGQSCPTYLSTLHLILLKQIPLSRLDPQGKQWTQSHILIHANTPLLLIAHRVRLDLK